MSEALKRALAALNEGRLEDAEALARDMAAAAPGDAGAHQLAAVVALRRGRLEEAERSTNLSLAIRPRHAPTLTLAGEIAERKSGPAAAAAWFRRAIEADPQRLEPWFKLCLAQLAAGDARAEATLAEALLRFPEAAQGWVEVGGALAGAGQWEAASVAYRRAAAGSGAAATAALVPLAKSLRALGRNGEARAALERRAATAPASSEALFLLALTCEDLRDTRAAIDAYRACAQLAPRNAQTRLNLALALQQSGDLGAALEGYRDAVRLDPAMLGRAAQALTSKPHGRLWLSPRALRADLGAPAPDTKSLAVDAWAAEQGLGG